MSISNTSGHSVVSFTKNGTKFLEIEGFILGNHLNIVEMKAYTSGGSANGILATIEEVSGSLFIPDGKYVLWPRAALKKQGSSPFFMAKAKS